MLRKKNLARPTHESELATSGSDLEDLTIHDASDPELGLTNIDDVPPEDWAADTGPTHSAEENAQNVDDELESEDGPLR